MRLQMFPLPERHSPRVHYAAEKIPSILTLIGTAPFVIALNTTSTVSTYTGLKTVEAMKSIYNTDLPNKQPSLWNFQRGVIPYVGKEIFRMPAKFATLKWFKPQTNEYFKNSDVGKFKANLTTALFGAALEAIMHPLDTLQKVLQSKQKENFSIQLNTSLLTSIRRLSAGVGISGVKKFLMLMAYLNVDAVANEKLLANSNLNPHSAIGIILKSIGESFAVTLLTWPLERVNREMQLRQKEIRQQVSESRLNGKLTYHYPTALRAICKAGTYWCGFAPKTFSHMFVLMVLNTINATGKPINKDE